jgi:hypothetical protein
MMPVPRSNPIALQANRNEGAHDDVYSRLKATAIDNWLSQCISRETCSVTSFSKTMRHLSSEATQVSRARLSRLYFG